MIKSKKLFACLSLSLCTLFVVDTRAEKKETPDHCRHIRVELYRNEANLEHKKVADSVGQAANEMSGSLKASFESSPELSKAWHQVIEGRPCDARSAEYVNILASCKANDFEQLAPLKEALEEYSQKCLTRAFWDQQLWRLLGGRDKSGLSQFMSAEFLQQYRRDNPNEPALHFGTIAGLNCCKPWRSYGAVFSALKPALGSLEAVQKAASDQKKLGALMKQHLFEPCQAYMRLVDELMSQASAAADYKRGGSQQDFIESLSSGFQDAIFRYKYCDSFIFVQNSLDKMQDRTVRKPKFGW